MTRAITDAVSATPSQVRTVFSDIVVPEIAKVGVAVDSARKLGKRSVASDVLIGSGLVTLGLTSGIFSPSVAAMVGAAGGLKALYTWAKKSADALSTPPSAVDHHYFFLWKAREMAQQSAKRPTVRTRT